MFFVCCGSNFDGRKDLTFYLFRVNIPPTANSPSKMSCSGSIFTTTSHPTVIFGTHGNSGDKRLKERVISRRKGYKVPEMPRKKLYYIFGTIRPQVRSLSLGPKILWNQPIPEDFDFKLSQIDYFIRLWYNVKNVERD